MLLLVLLCAIGMYAVSLPGPAGQSLSKYQQEAVARNMAKAGAHAAIARLPEISPLGSPYARRIPAGPNLTGRYVVTSRKTATRDSSGPDARSVFEEYTVTSEGGVTKDPGVKFRVEAVVRHGAPGTRPQIRKWEESRVQ